MTTRLQNLRRAGFVCTGAIDGGAYLGNWSLEFSKVFGEVAILLVEPQPASQAILTSLIQRHAAWQVAAVALSDRSGESLFRLGESNSGLVPSPQEDPVTIAVPCSTLEQLLKERAAFEPNLLKLDLQGHELQALRGAGTELPRFEVIITEISMLRIGDVPIFHEVDNFMEAQGYRLYDLLPQYDRPLDGALWQIDAFYVRLDSALIASRAWD
ncbi:FkbM family methyltransferase [Cyanobium sp. Morenito 9A2]|uniref:FkbM family methyltransferase n=1 Tax=Cyanobium sp. Morenito 9A2 TaxID=2823718 RepID=UPI0020CF5E6C|nr:FkbM family methyltransferase [Cyanobium sp. Morenito 9A2]MCP9849786.1 FkbM family methyltransferase [Cyanobium sp. Morenito 9A2]